MYITKKTSAMIISCAALLTSAGIVFADGPKAKHGVYLMSYLDYPTEIKYTICPPEATSINDPKCTPGTAQLGATNSPDSSKNISSDDILSNNFPPPHLSVIEVSDISNPSSPVLKQQAGRCEALLFKGDSTGLTIQGNHSPYFTCTEILP